jgi:hypothetical protein
VTEQLFLPQDTGSSPEELAPAAPRTRAEMKADIEQALRERFAPPQYAIFFEVPSATGGAASRRADAIAMALWPSLGLEIVGIEIKVDRRDWLRELKQPAKAQELARFCDRWVIATAPGVVKLEELPPAWGLLVLRGKGLRQEREAPRLAAQPIERTFLASLLRAASEANPAEQAIRKAVEAAHAEESAAAKKQRDTDEGYAQKNYGALKKAVGEFEAASGISISRYDGPALGAAVRLVLDREWKLQEMEAASKRLRVTATELEAARAEIAALTPAPAPPAAEGSTP